MLLRSIIDYLFPRHCLICHERLTVTEKTLCLTCEVRLPRTMIWTKPAESNQFLDRFKGRVEVENAFPYIYYDPKGGIAEIIYDFKYHHNRFAAYDMGKKFGLELNQSGLFSDADYLIPVPLTPKRCHARGYNQSIELCLGISAVTHIPIIKDALIRTHFHLSQTQLSRYERIENVSGAFKLNHEVSASLVGKHVVLVDDVITTGSTTIECTKTLKQIPDIRVTIISLAGRRILND